MKRFLFLLLLAGIAEAQTFTIAPTSSNAGTATPVLTWDMPGYLSCLASDGWSGAKAITGTQSLAAITATTAPVTVCHKLTCTGPSGTGQATVSWIPPTKNANDTPLTDLATFRIGYRNIYTTISAKTCCNSCMSSSISAGVVFIRHYTGFPVTSSATAETNS